jgi:hypothetical protein
MSKFDRIALKLKKIQKFPKIALKTFIFEFVLTLNLFKTYLAIENN